MADGKKLWGGRFKESADPGFAAFNNSFRFDVRLFEVDVEASLAYARALTNAQILNEADSVAIINGLRTILERAQSDPDYFADDSAEDVHSFVEMRLVELTGHAGRKL